MGLTIFFFVSPLKVKDTGILTQISAQERKRQEVGCPVSAYVCVLVCTEETGRDVLGGI